MQDYQLLNSYLVIGSMLFGIGIVGLVARRGLVYIVLSASIMMQGIYVAAIGCGAFHGNNVGQIVTLIGLSVSVMQILIAAVFFRCSDAGHESRNTALRESLDTAQFSTDRTTEKQTDGVIDA